MNKPTSSSQQLQQQPFLPQSEHGCVPQGTGVSDCTPHQSSNQSAASSASGGHASGQSKSTSRFPLTYRLLPWLILLVVLGLGYASTIYIDYEYSVFLVKRQLEGRPVESCLDLPTKYWSRIPKCVDLYYPEEPQPTRGGEDSEAV